MKLIPLDAVLAEFDRLIVELTKGENTMFEQGRISALEDGKMFANSLDVKEVDLVKEYDKEYFNDPVYGKLINRNAGIGIAKHFFELGVNASNPLTWEDMNELYIIFADIDTDIELGLTDIKSETIGYYQEVLKRFKAQKGG